jgi:hypothetical protein
MSIKIMAMVWDLPKDQIDRNEKYVLLAYADHADAEGRNIYPAIATIVRKTGYEERAAQLITHQLEADGFLIPDGIGPKGTNRWRIPLADGGAKIAPLQNLQGAKKDESLGAKIAPALGAKIAPELKPEPRDIETREMTNEQKAWEITKANLKLEMPKHSYDEYLEPTRAIGFEDGTLMVETTDQDASEWLSDRMTSTARRMLSGILNQEVQIVWTNPHLAEVPA